MKTIVCIKQVPSTNEVRLDPETHTIIRDGRQSITNPFDTYAIEQAVQIKEETGGEVIGLSMGIPETERLLRDSISRGVDSAVLLTDRQFAGADTLATAYTLSLGIKSIGAYDVVLCGKMAVDGDTGQIGPELAEYLGIPHVTDVTKIVKVDGKVVTCERVTDYGYQTIEVRLPALLTVVKDINLPRLPTISGIKFSLDAPVMLKNVESVKADVNKIGLLGSPTQVVKTYVPDKDNDIEEIHGDVLVQSKKLIDIIKKVI